MPETGYCDFCGGEAVRSDHRGYYHRECLMEESRRYNAGICAKCNAKPRVEPTFGCGECTIDSPYIGYPRRGSDGREV